MDDAIDRMYMFLDDDHVIDEKERFEAEVVNATDAIKLISPPVQPKIAKPKKAMIEVDYFDPSQNVLNSGAMEEFKSVKFEESDIFTEPVTTTITMEGFLTNVWFHEAELIQSLLPDEWIVVIRCNYGKLIYPGYQEPIKIKTSNRGRKKKEKKRKQRKIQGAGTDFNSQVTFFVRSGLDPDYPEDEEGIVHVPSSARVYKFKIFRTGKLQLPGVQPALIDDVISGVGRLTQLLEHYTGKPDKPIRVVNLNPVMKNYRFNLKLGDKIIDLPGLFELLVQLKTGIIEPGEDALHYPPIFDLKYSREDTKLSIRFTTPIHNKPNKRTRVNIFMRGKINILGAFDTETTRQIIAFLEWIFRENPELMVDEAEETYQWEDNIHHPESVNEMQKICQAALQRLPELPVLTDADIRSIYDFIDGYNAEVAAAADHALREMLKGTELEGLI